MKVLAGIVPASVAAVERFADEPGVPLFTAEEAAVSRAVLKRRNEFATTRHCARLALATLGIDAVALVPGQRGAPVWPPGVVGSMTHCDGYRAAVVARDTDVRTLGIDAEPHEPLPKGVLSLVSSPAERRHLDELSATVPTIAWDRILFSAKESIYKAWFPVAREWLGFDEAEVTLDPDHGTFDGMIRRSAANGADLGRIRGRWTVARQLLATAIVIAA
jgi:enterobactin synthetase component D / holo-[acyl-carrier protein] synthase